MACANTNHSSSMVKQVYFYIIICIVAPITIYTTKHLESPSSSTYDRNKTAARNIVFIAALTTLVQHYM